MPDLVAELAERARGLPADERSRLVDLLLESLHEAPLAEIESAWEARAGRNETPPRRRLSIRLFYTPIDGGDLIHAISIDHQMPEYWLSRMRERNG